MKKVSVVLIMVLVFYLSVYAAEPKKAQTSDVWQGEQIPTMEESLDKISQTGGFVEMPCFIPDVDTDFFACTGIHQGRKNQNKEEVKAFALVRALDSCQEKSIHSTAGIFNFYSNGRDTRIHVVDYERYIVYKSAVSEVAQLSCVKYSIKDGMVEAYVGIKVPKKELSEKVSEEEKIFLKDRLPEKNPTDIEKNVCPDGYHEAGKGRCCPAGMLFINNKCQVPTK